MVVQYCNRDGSVLFGKLAQIMKYHCHALSAINLTQQE